MPDNGIRASHKPLDPLRDGIYSTNILGQSNKLAPTRYALLRDLRVSAVKSVFDVVRGKKLL
ncbi:hypothetical protein GCM10011357_00950 [Lacimicrobium alkaliphilum]|uniref:Uncharacterized protein n=1 Tax=Lacimicrobium alkaliphilum TaxID=1526571 RepID=A0ABQ1QVU3_9ALTE|nr:hypothetical protein GCM10011357_00950 [Lacimicrobium alkaliphilum]